LSVTDCFYGFSEGVTFFNWNALFFPIKVMGHFDAVMPLIAGTPDCLLALNAASFVDCDAALPRARQPIEG
jgi:hypothetical protein